MGITLYDTPKVYKIKDEKLCPIFPATIAVKGECELQTVYNNQTPEIKRWLFVDDKVMYSEEFILNNYIL